MPAGDGTAPLLGGLAEHEVIHYGSVLDPCPFPVEALAGRGTIAPTDVRCESPEWAVRWRTGYPPRPNDLHDVPLLCARFGIPLPAGF